MKYKKRKHFIFSTFATKETICNLTKRLFAGKHVTIALFSSVLLIYLFSFKTDECVHLNEVPGASIARGNLSGSKV